jgi:hypothetical protein
MATPKKSPSTEPVPPRPAEPQVGDLVAIDQHDALAKELREANEAMRETGGAIRAAVARIEESYARIEEPPREPVPPAPAPRAEPQIGDLVAVEFVVGQVYPEVGTVDLVRKGPVRGKVEAGLYGFMQYVGALASDCWFRPSGTATDRSPHLPVITEAQTSQRGRSNGDT